MVTKEYLEGAQAGREARSLNHNPYMTNSYAWQDWREGWSAAYTSAGHYDDVIEEETEPDQDKRSWSLDDRYRKE